MESTLNESATISIYTIEGKLIYDLDLEPGSTHLNIGDLPKGIYFLKISGNESSTVTKFIKE